MKSTAPFWRLWRRARFRYDLFISYAHVDIAYARQLLEQLRLLDFTVFFDEDEIQAGDKLTDALKLALDRSAMLVVVGTSAAAKSDFVKLEVEYFKRRIVPVNIEHGADDASWLKSADLVWITEIASRSPSPVVAQAIEKHFEFRKRHVVNRLKTLAVGVFVAAITAVSVIIINDRIRRERDARQAMEHQQALASLSEARARRETRNAESAQRLAHESALDLAQEQGRLELLRGDRRRALASLADVYAARPTNAALRYLVATAARGTEAEIDLGPFLLSAQTTPRRGFDEVDISADESRIVTLRTGTRLWDGRGRAVATLRRPNARNDETATVARFLNGGLLVTGAARRLSVWRASDGRWLRDFPPVDSAVIDIAVAAKGQRILLATASKAYLVDIATGITHSLAESWSCLANPVFPCLHSNLQFARDGSAAAVIDRDGVIRIFRAADAVLLNKFDQSAVASAFGAEPPSTSMSKSSLVALSPDGRLLAVASSRRIGLLDTLSGKLVSKVDFIPTDRDSDVMPMSVGSGVTRLEFSSDGRHVVASAFNDVVVWSYDDAMRGWPTELSFRVQGTQFRLSPDSLRLMAMGGELSYDDARIYNLESGVLITTREWRQGDYFASARWSGDGQRLVVTSRRDSVVHIWNVAPDDRIAVRFRSSRSPTTLLTPDGRHLLVAEDRSLRRIDTVSGKELGGLELPPEQPAIAATSSDAVRGLLRKGERTWSFDFSSRQLRSLDFHVASLSADGSRTAAITDKKIVIRSFEGRRLKVFRTNEDLRWVRFSHLGNLLITRSGRDFAVRDARSGRVLRRIESCDVEISPDEKWAAVIDCQQLHRTIRLQSLLDSRSFVLSRYSADAELRDPTSYLNQPLTFSDDSCVLLTAPYGEPMQLWTVDDGRRFRTLPSKGWQIAPAFDHDHSLLAVVEEASVRLYDIASGALVAILTDSGERLCRAAFVADGDYLAAVSCRWNTPATLFIPSNPPWTIKVPLWNTAREHRPPAEIQELIAESMR